MPRLNSEQQARLAEMGEALRSGGIAVSYEEEPDRLVIRFAVLDGCADCMIPEPMMKTLVADAVGSAYGESEISLIYPSTAK